MNLSEVECRRLVADSDHGVLATVNRDRGVDAVPVVYAPVAAKLVIPIDTVKAKRHTHLQRLDNVAADDRCVLLVEHYNPDWSQLWWVRVHARAATSEPDAQAVAALAERYPTYRLPGSITQLLVLQPEAWFGWRAEQP